jgi:condensin complex subunit 3
MASQIASKEETLEKKIGKKIAMQLNRAQKTIAAHRRCAVALRKLQEQEPKVFFEQFLHMIKPILLVFKREPNVERLIQFVIQYISNAERINHENESENQRRNSGLVVDDMDETTRRFCFDMIRELLKFAHAKDKAIRFRVCQIVAGLINLMPEQIEIEDDLCEQLLDTIVCRLKDKAPIVRQQAVCILARIHNPVDPEDQITNEYIRLMATDSNKDVRKEVVKCIIPSKYTLPAILERTRDVKDDVRRAAYEKLFTDCPLKRISISERVSILNNGLKDRSPSVQETCVSLLATQWLGQQMNNDIFALLGALDVENYTEVCELALNSLFSYKNNELNQYIYGKQVQLNNLTPEEALYLRTKIQHLISQKRDEELEEILPNVTEFCTIIAAHYKDGHEFITKQCMIIAKYLDYSDEVGRKNIHIILKHMLIVFQQPDHHVSEIIQALKVVLPSEEEFRSTIHESIEPLRKLVASIASSEESSNANKQKEAIRDNIKKYNSKLRKLKKEESQLRDELEEAKKLKDKDMRAEIMEDLEKVVKRANDIKSAVQELEEELNVVDVVRKDVMVWLRALYILKEVNKTVSPASVQRLLGESDILKSVVLPCITHESVYVRDASLCVLGQYCTMYLPFAQKYINLFTNTLNDRKEETSTHKTCLAAVFDIMHAHSFDTVYEKCDKEEKEGSISDLIETVKELMLEQEICELATIAVEGCCKLIAFNKLQEDHVLEVLSNMIIALFNPATESFLQMKQCLSTFLPAFIFSSIKNMNRIANIAVSTLHRISSNFSKINLLQVGQFLIYLTDLSHLKNAPKVIDCDPPHSVFALQLASDILREEKKEANTYCKLLTHFGTFHDKTFIQKLSLIIAEIKSKITDRVTSRIIEKFLSTLVVNENGENNVETNPDEEVLHSA